MSGRAPFYTPVVLLALAWMAGMAASETRHRQATPLLLTDSTGVNEFVGPFPSWTNVKTAYGASGDGKTDDTLAIQRALSQLSTQGHSPVLYFPGGTYRITRTLTLAYTINVSVVGEDPATTTIIWDGEEGGTMMAVNGVAYSSFSRLTFDGKRRAAVAVEQSWDNQQPHFDSGNQYADNRFVDVGYGIHGGFKGHGFAETSIVRSHFVRNREAGVALGNFNALDIWIWDSRFEDCGFGVTNGTGAGNFHVYSSVFQRSKSADLAMGNTGGFSARGNYSIGSQAFFISVVTKAYPATIHLQRNTIIDPVDLPPIDLKNQGPGIFTDNVVRLMRGPGPAIRWKSFNGADVTSIGNTFTVAKAIHNNGRLIAFGDRVVASTAIPHAEPSLPATPRNLARPVFEVAPGARAAEIQKIIDQAAQLPGKRPIVHFRYGAYSIDATLTIPSSDIQLVGDGFATVLRWAGRGQGPLLKIVGPSRATIRDLQIDGGATADGIIGENVDQVGARVSLDQLQLRSGKQTDFFVKGIDHASIELRDFGHAYSPGATSVKVTGGPLLTASQSAAGRTNIFSGAASGNTVSYEVSDGARLLVRDLWYESGAGPGFARIHGNATFTLDGARISAPVNQAVPAIDIRDLRGRVALIATHLDDRVVLSGNGSAAEVLALALYDQQQSAAYFVDTGKPAAKVRRLNSRNAMWGNRSIASPDIGAADGDFLEALLKHTRDEMPNVAREVPPGATDLRLFRVWVANGINNLTIAR